MTTTDTSLQQLVINVGTTAQIEAAIAGGTITEDMLSISTDGPTYLVSTDIVSSVDSSSTNAKAVGAKLFYDTCGNIEATLNAIRGV
jgi:hypothetical protein